MCISIIGDKIELKVVISMSKKILTFFLSLVVLITIGIIVKYNSNSNKYLIIEDWGALPVSKERSHFIYQDKLKNIYKYIVIHHSGVKELDSAEKIQFVHLLRGYYDIGYHFVIDADGSIFKGRNVNIMGAHAGQTKQANDLAREYKGDKKDSTYIQIMQKDPDYGAIGICLTGNFNIEKPKIEQLESLGYLIKKLIDMYHIPVSGIILHSEVEKKILFPRKLELEGARTECPGKNAILPIKEIVSRLEN